MAKDKAETAEAADAPKGNKKMIIIIAATAVVVMLAAGLVFKTLLAPKEPAKDLTKEPGAVGEPLYQDILTALYEGRASGRPSLVCSQAFDQHFARRVVVQFGRRSSWARAENERERGVETDVVDQLHRFLEVLRRFSGKADDEIRR